MGEAHCIRCGRGERGFAPVRLFWTADQTWWCPACLWWEVERQRADLARVMKLWGHLHTACSELVSQVETVGDMRDEAGLPFWELELANALRWLHYYPSTQAPKPPKENQT